MINKALMILFFIVTAQNAMGQSAGHNGGTGAVGFASDFTGGTGGRDGSVGFPATRFDCEISALDPVVRASELTVDGRRSISTIVFFEIPGTDSSRTPECVKNISRRFLKHFSVHKAEVKGEDGFTIRGYPRTFIGNTSSPFLKSPSDEIFISESNLARSKRLSSIVKAASELEGILVLKISGDEFTPVRANLAAGPNGSVIALNENNEAIETVHSNRHFNGTTYYVETDYQVDLMGNRIRLIEVRERSNRIP